jgi:hypothetical protein
MSREETKKIAEDCMLKYVFSGVSFRHATYCAIMEQKAILAELKTIGDTACKFQYESHPDETLRLLKIRYSKIEDVIIELQDML